jgi:hypothetical protein
LHHGIEALAQVAGAFGGSFMTVVTPLALDCLTGVIAGAAALALWTLVQHLRRDRFRKRAA